MTEDNDPDKKENSGSRESMTRPKILVVDDEPMNVEIFEGYLFNDYNIIKAYNGDEALRKVETTNPDLILLDVMMPGKNGFEICKILKEHPKTMSIPIIIVTALKEKEERIKGIEAGADDFITKPIDILEVTARIKSLLKVKQYYDALMGDCHFLL